MRKRMAVSSAVAALLFCSPYYADFRYSETSQITGGAMVGMMKFVGHFSKDAKQSMEPMVSTIYVKGNRMRREEPMGKVHIVDLDGRRMIDIDQNQRTYSVITFDQMRAAMEAARAKAAQQQAAHGNASPQSANVKVTPKIQVTPTGATRTIMNLPTKEVKMRMDMEMQSQDPRAQGQSVTTWFTTDSWLAPDVPGYDEVRKFYARMAQELNWLPGAMFGGMSGGGGAGGMQISPAAMTEFRKQSASMSGTPLLQYISMGMGGNGAMTANTGTQSQQSASQQQAGAQGGSQSQSSPGEMMPQAAVAKALGGLFGKKKKQQDQEQNTSGSGQAAASKAPPPGASTPGSLMDMTVQVTALSSDSIPGGLFEIPAGYTQVQGNPDQVLGTAAPRR